MAMKTFCDVSKSYQRVVLSVWKFSLTPVAIAMTLANPLKAFAEDPYLWYNGDAVPDAWIVASEITYDPTEYNYDDFTVPAGQTWNITSISGYYSTDFFGGNNAYWEIRSGVTLGNGGTLVASGRDIFNTTSVPGANGYLGFLIEVPINVTLSSGSYWLCLSPNVSAPTNCYVSTTCGTNAIGTTPNNGNTFYSIPFYGVNFASLNNGSNVDLAYGIRGNKGPEIKSISPSTILRGSPTTLLTINGSGFNSNSYVKFDGVNYTPISRTSTRITVHIPASALTNERWAKTVVFNIGNGGATAQNSNKEYVQVNGALLNYTVLSSSRNANGNIVLNVRITNSGNRVATNAEVGSGMLNGINPIGTANFGNIPVGGSATANVRFPGTAGAVGTNANMTLIMRNVLGSQTGQFIQSSSVVLP